MTTYARMSNGTAEEIWIAPSGVTPTEAFHPTIAALFTEVPDGTTVGSTLNGSAWTVAPPLTPNVPPTIFPTLTPMAFYLAFAPAERIAIKASTDAVTKEFWATYELAAQLNESIDMNLVSVQDGLAYLAVPTTATPPGVGLIAPARVAQILNGIPQ